MTNFAFGRRAGRRCFKSSGMCRNAGIDAGNHSGALSAVNLKHAVGQDSKDLVDRYNDMGCIEGGLKNG